MHLDPSLPVLQSFMAGQDEELAYHAIQARRWGVWGGVGVGGARGRGGAGSVVWHAVVWCGVEPERLRLPCQPLVPVLSTRLFHPRHPRSLPAGAGHCAEAPRVLQQGLSARGARLLLPRPKREGVGSTVCKTACILLACLPLCAPCAQARRTQNTWSALF